jgi:hypothetical protein
MNHIKKLNEFTNYSDDLGETLPRELLNTGEDSDDIGAEDSSDILSLSPKLRAVIGQIMNLSAQGEYDEVEDIYSTLTDEEVDRITDLLERLTDIFSNQFRNKVRQN